MPFINIKGLPGKVYVPEKLPDNQKKINELHEIVDRCELVCLTNKEATLIKEVIKKETVKEYYQCLLFSLSKLINSTLAKKNPFLRIIKYEYLYLIYSMMILMG